MLTGAAPNAENIETHNGTTGTRILKLARSSGILIGCVLLVICRKPLSQTELNGTRPTFSILRRMKLPTSPSIAAQTLSYLVKAKPTPVSDAVGMSVERTVPGIV